MHDYLLKWIAHMIQCPGKLPRTYLFLQSDAHGVGKNTVTDIVGCLLGPQYTWTTDRHKKALANGGETEGRDRLLLVLDEAQPGDIPAGQLNNAVTAGRIPLRKLYENTIDIQNVLRIVITTNFLASSVAVEGDRRMVLLACTNYWHRLENKENHDWSINELTRLFGIDGEFAVGHFRERAMCILYHWFLRMDITDFKPADIPQTPLTKEVKQLHNSPVWEFAKTLRHTRYRVYSEDSSKACDIREQTLDDAKRSRYEIRIKDLYDAYEYYASKYLSVEEGRKLGIKRFRDQMFSNRNSPLNKMSGVFTVKGPLNAHDTVVEIHPSGEGYIGDSFKLRLNSCALSDGAPLVARSRVFSRLWATCVALLEERIFLSIAALCASCQSRNDDTCSNNVLFGRRPGICFLFLMFVVLRLCVWVASGIRLWWFSSP